MIAYLWAAAFERMREAALDRDPRSIRIDVDPSRTSFEGATR
jgi:hypothetical protein